MSGLGHVARCGVTSTKGGTIRLLGLLVLALTLAVATNTASAVPAPSPTPFKLSITSVPDGPFSADGKGLALSFWASVDPVRRSRP